MNPPLSESKLLEIRKAIIDRLPDTHYAFVVVAERGRIGDKCLTVLYPTEQVSFLETARIMAALTSSVCS